jgi:hypothetical protein
MDRLKYRPWFLESMMVRTRLVALSVSILLLAGCFKAPPPPIVPAQGIILLEGRPLARVEVRFIPDIEYGTEYIAKGVTDDTGRFELTCKGQPGACVGENRVIIVEAELPDRVKGENAQAELAKYKASLGPRPPPRYGNLIDSNVTVEVHAGRTDYSFELEP